MATVYTEARVHAANVCRATIQSMGLCYVGDSPFVHKRGGMEILQPDLPKQTTATVITTCEEEDGWKVFDSAEHLVDIVHRVFSGGAKRIVLTSWFYTRDNLEGFYCPYTPRIMDMQFKWVCSNTIRRSHQRLYRNIDSLTPVAQGHDQPALFMTRCLLAYKTDNRVDHSDAVTIAHHLLKVFEVFDASMRQLLQVESFELLLQTFHWDDVFLTNFTAVKRENGLWVDWTGVQCEIIHSHANPCEFDLEMDADSVHGASSVMRRLWAPLRSLRHQIHRVLTNMSRAGR